MPGFILHVGAQATCLHGGQAQATVPNPRVLVDGQPTVLSTAPWVVAGCGLTGSAPPCVTANWTSFATKLLSGGVPLLLQDSQAACVAPGTGLLVTRTQLRVTGR